MKDIYNTKVVSVGPETELGDIANIMSEQKVHTLPVVDDGKMVGGDRKIRPDPGDAVVFWMELFRPRFMVGDPELIRLRDKIHE